MLGCSDQSCDYVAWGVDVCKRVNSPRVKILFDIVVQNIRDNFQGIAHFHTGGVPGRREIDGTRKLNYRFIAQTIAELGFTGYIAHKYRPAPGMIRSKDWIVRWRSWTFSVARVG